MTCSTRFRRLLQASCLGLIGTLTVVGCGGSDTTKKDGGPGGNTGDVGQAQGTVKVDQVALLFGSIDVGTPSAPKTVTATISGAPVALNATVTGDGFAISENLCKPLQPVGTCTISVVFAPTRVGGASGSLTVGGATVSLSGTGTQPGVFVVSPESFPLGTQLVGASAPVSFDIIPSGTVPSVSCLPSGADLTLATTTCPAAGVAVSARCSYTFTFKAASAGDKAEGIVCNGGGTTRTVSVTAKVVTPAALSISPATQSFTAKVGQPVTWTFNVSNTGGAQTGNVTAAVTGAGFAITGNDCPPQLAGFGLCKVQVTFNPATAGAVTGALTVKDDTPGSTPATAALSGNGVSSNVTITPATKDFASVTIGQSLAAAFTMVNGGTAATGIIALASADAQFVVGGDLCSGHALEAKGQCTFSISFAPNKVGLQQASVNASQTSDDAVLASVAVSGTGVAAPTPAKLTVNPPTLDFGTTGVGVPVGPKVFTIKNEGGTATGALSVVKNDSTSSVGGASQFNVTGNTCTAALAPNATCQLAVTYAPTITKSASAVITVSDGTTSSAEGTVTGIALAIPTLAIDCADFDNTGTVVGTKNTVVCTVTNTVPLGGGDTPQESGAITITAAGTDKTAAADFSIGTNNCTASLQPNLSCTFQLVFTPSAKGVRSGMLTVTSANKGAANQVLEALGLLTVEIVEHATCTPVYSGTGGTLTQIGCTPDVITGYDFGQVSLGANSTTILTLDVYVRGQVGNLDISGTNFQWVPDGDTAPADFIKSNPSTKPCAKTTSSAPTPVKGQPYCSMYVTFSPKSKKAGLANTVTAKSADGTFSDTAAMSGSGTGPITVSPSQLTFTSVAVGSSSATPMTLTVCNNAPTDGSASTFTITGANASMFAVVDDTVSNQTLKASHDPCKYVQLRLDIPAGTAPGQLTATVTVTSTIAGVVESGSATLFGAAVTGAALDAVLNGAFADTPVTRTSAPVTVTVTNKGAIDTDFIRFEIPNPGHAANAGEFTYNPDVVDPANPPAQGTCTINGHTKLVPNASCDLKVWFMPTAVLGTNNQRRATLVVSSKTGGMKTIDLVGKATAQLTITPSENTVDDTDLGDTAGGTKVFTITNYGGQATPPTLTVGIRNGINQTGGAEFKRKNTSKSTECQGTIGAYGTYDGSQKPLWWCTVDLNLQAAAGALPGPRAATVYAQTNATQEATATIKGTAVKPAKLWLTVDQSEDTSASTVDRHFGTVTLNPTDGPYVASTPQTFTVTNVGGRKAGKISVKLFNLSTHTHPGIYTPASYEEKINEEHKKTSEFVTAGTCLGQSDATVLSPGQSCTITVAFQPSECVQPTKATCPYTTGNDGLPVDVQMIVYADPGTNAPAGTPPGLWGPKLYGTASADTGALYAVTSGGLQAYDFGTVSTTDAKSVTLTLKNTTSDGINLPAASAVKFDDLLTPGTDPSSTVTGAGEFVASAVTNGCVLDGTGSLNANASCAFKVTWTPSSLSAVGTREVAMTFGTTVVSGLFARVGMPASLVVVPYPLGAVGTPVDFGTTEVENDSKETRTLTIRNVGERASGDIKVGKTAAAGEVIVLPGSTCQPPNSSLVGGAACIVNLGVHASTTADYTSAPVDGLAIIPSANTGVAGNLLRDGHIFATWIAINAAGIVADPSTVKFDDTSSALPGTAVLSAGTSKKITLSNLSGSNKTGTLSFGTDKSDFLIDLRPTVSTCLADTMYLDGITAGHSCDVYVVFSPASLANPAKSGKLSVTSASGAAVDVILNTATALPALSVGSTASGFSATTADAMAKLTFPATAINGKSDVTFTITKASGSPATGLLSTGIGGGTGSNPDQFKIVTDNCIGVSLMDTDDPSTSTVTEGPTCTVTVRFAPTASGTGKNAVLQVTDPTSGTPADAVSVALKGDVNG